jgi:DNA polymerase/3'-5' exonuclease PolX
MTTVGTIRKKLKTIKNTKITNVLYFLKDYKSTTSVKDVLSDIKKNKNLDVQLFLKSTSIWYDGIGPSKALSLWESGVRPSNIKSPKNMKKLPIHTRMFLTHCPLKQIPIQNTLELYNKFVPFEKRKHSILGSYRRGKPFQSDIDILYWGDFDKFLDKIQKKWNNKWIPYAKGPSKVSGIFVGTPTVKIDIWIATAENKHAMTLYATGSFINNIIMRKHAKTMGLLLNQYGLFKNGKIIKTGSERDIYKRLNMKYRKPEER